MWFFNNNKQSSRDINQDRKIDESQRALIEAARSTTDMANMVTISLKNKLDDAVAKFDSTIKILNDALIITDIEGVIQAYNPSAEKLFGFNTTSSNTFFGSYLSCDTHALYDGEDVWQILQQISDGEEDHVLYGIHAGNQFVIDVNHTMLEQSDGSTMVLLVVKPVVEYETEFEKSHVFKNLFDAFPDGIIVIKEQKIVAANTSASKIIGLPIETLLSKTLEDVTDEAQDAAGRIDMSFTSANITWYGEDALLLTIRDLTEVIHDKNNQICCFGEDYVLTFVNGSFASAYSAKVGDDIRKVLPDDEKHAMLLNIHKLTNTQSSRTIRLNSATKSMVWTDCFCEIDGKIEYQRIGKSS